MPHQRRITIKPLLVSVFPFLFSLVNPSAYYTLRVVPGVALFNSFPTFIREFSLEIICHYNSARGVTKPDGTVRIVRIKSDIENEKKIFDYNNNQYFHFHSSVRSAKKSNDFLGFTLPEKTKFCFAPSQKTITVTNFTAKPLQTKILTA